MRFQVGPSPSSILLNDMKDQQSSSLEVTVADKGKFLTALSNEGFIVNETVPSLIGKILGTYHPYDNARAKTLYQKDPQLHLSNDKVEDPNYGPNYFWAHFDRTSVNASVGQGPLGQAVAGKEHDKGFASPQRVREYLKRTGQAPR